MLYREYLKNFLGRRTSIKQFFCPARTVFSKKKNKTTQEWIKQEETHLANIYEPLPIVINKGEGTRIWDVEGNLYLDFIAGHATLNTGHCHPKLVKTASEQMSNLHLTSRAVYNRLLPEFGEFMTHLFRYDKIIPMNTGVEAGETAIKIARRWGYLRKKIPENEAVVILAKNNFWGRTTAAVSSSTNPVMRNLFGPYMPGLSLVPYDNIPALEEALCNPNVCAFMVEPIQGEAGAIVPGENYLSEVRRICTEKNVLWIADEVQTGLGRTGYLIACDHECVRPDLLLLGKAISAGLLPISAVLGNEEVMHVMTPGTHGSTFGGNPLACSIAMQTINLILQEKLIENAKKLGEIFRSELQCRLSKDVVPIIRGRGLLNAITINPSLGHARDICIKMAKGGLLAKNSNDFTIKFTPPLIINEAEIFQAVQIISDVIHSLKSTNIC